MKFKLKSKLSKISFSVLIISFEETSLEVVSQLNSFFKTIGYGSENLVDK